jgi:hypothetical protein
MISTKAPSFTASVVSFTLLLCLYAFNSGSTTQNPLHVLKQDSEPTDAGEIGLWQAMDSQNNIWTHEKHPNTALLHNFMAVGIGPAKTGSTAISRKLCKNTGVLCGRRQRPGQPKQMTVELMVLSGDVILRDGPSALDPYFSQNRTLSAKGSKPVMLFEKTPHYAANIQAPLVAAKLLPAHTKYIYTLRNFSTQDMSLYMHREAHKKNITYSQWVDESVQMHKKWDMCRKKVLDKIVPPRYKNEVRSTYLVDGLLSDAKFVAPEQSYWIEKQMSKTCGIPAPDFRPRDLFEELLHHRNLIRWARYVGQDRILCVSDEAQKRAACAVTKALNAFLALKDPLEDNDSCDAVREERTTVERLADANPGLQSKADVMAAAYRLKDYVESIARLEKRLVDDAVGACDARFLDML